MMIHVRLVTFLIASFVLQKLLVFLIYKYQLISNKLILKISYLQYIRILFIGCPCINNKANEETYHEQADKTNIIEVYLLKLIYLGFEDVFRTKTTLVSHCE